MLFPKSLGLLSAAILLSFPALAKAADVPAYPFYVKKLAEGGAQVRYLGDDAGMQGWLVIYNGKPEYIYNTPNQEAYIVGGILLDRKGQPVTEKQVERLLQPAAERLKKVLGEPEAQAERAAAKPTFDKDGPAAKLMADMAKAPYVSVGDPKAPLVYAIIDPDCPHCHQFIKDLEASGALEASRVRLHLIVAGILSDKSLKRAATVLAQGPEKGGEMLMRHINGGEEDRIPVQDDVKLDKVRENLALMQKWKLDATPLILYQSKEGDIRIIRGKPADPTILVEDLPR